MATRAKTRLDQIQTLLSDRTFKNRIMSFLEKYMECEVVCKELIVENRAKSRNPVKYDDVEIVFGSVQAAVRNASMKIDENTLKRIFTANTKKGERSAKKLRDAIVHKMPNSELKEVNRRYKELMKDMKAFLRAVK